MEVIVEQQPDYRPMFKRFMGVGYFTDKAKELRISRFTLSRILGGTQSNPDILYECLSELNKRIRQLNAELEDNRRQREIHRQLQGA